MNIEEIKQQWEQTSPLQKFLLVAAVCGGLVYSVYTFVLSPKLEEQAQLQTEVEELDNKLSNIKLRSSPEGIKNIEKKIENIRQQISELDKQLASYSSAIPYEPATEKVLDFIGNLAYSHRLKLLSYKTEDRGDIKLYYDEAEKKIKELKDEKKDINNLQMVTMRKVGISFAVTGSITDIRDFIDGLKKSERVLMFEKVELRKEGSSIRADVTVYSYYRGGE